MMIFLTKIKSAPVQTYISIFFIVLFSQLNAQENQSINLQLGVVALQSDSITNENPAAFISTKLLENLASCLIFSIDNPEIIKNVMTREMNNKITNLQKELGALKEKLDMTSFIIDKNRKQKAYRDALKALQQKQQEYEKLQIQNVVPTTKQLKISVVQKLYNNSINNPLIFCEQNKLDFLVFGTIRVIDTLFLVSIKLYSAISQEIIYSTTIVGNNTTIAQNVFDTARSIAETVLEKKLCVIKFNGNPSTASIYVNDVKLDSMTYVCLDAEKLSIQITARGYTKHVDELSLVQGTSYSYSFELKPIPLKTISIITVPDNADVYVNAIPAGQSPLQLEVNTDQDIVTVDKDDYTQVQVTLNTITDELVINLEKNNGMTFEDTFEQAKSRFYKSLGWFVLSLPLSTLSYGSFMSIYQTELELQQKVLTGQISVSEAIYAEQQLNTRFWLYQSAFWVSLALSSGLGINTIINLIRYISTM
ncbi:MAG TPA: PEGA domain-containing protein [Spirochaetia bacterium]|nr:PEGA domain-containing protein [Spirochaetales bacterium]HQK33504.1 PEGA domain-containing protein [Spirochaetales bacterium]HRS65323.1 PEGA domain-containing protein [Spirochaetia bacterium]